MRVPAGSRSGRAARQPALQLRSPPHRDHGGRSAANFLMFQHHHVDRRRVVGHLSPRRQAAFPDHHRFSRAFRDQAPRLLQRAVIHRERGADLLERSQGEAAVHVGPRLLESCRVARRGRAFEIPAAMLEVGVVDIQESGTTSIRMAGRRGE